MTTWLVTGGAGYIGAHVVRELAASGRGVVVLDDFSSGLERKVPEGMPVVRTSVADREVVSAALVEHRVDGVIHLAAKKAAGESVDIPLHYYRENVVGMLSLLEAMHDNGVKRFVYSSSAAVYGTPLANPISEDSPLVPESPYGETKVVGEWMTRDQGIASGLSWVALRYFNVAGPASDDLGDNSVNNLVPMVFRALADGDRPRIFGDDYPTPDGTCIRDYIHVLDLAQAHILALESLDSGSRTYNLGNGTGFSVKEVIEAAREITGHPIPVRIQARRAGDPAALVAASGRIQAELGWQPVYPSMHDIIASAWMWHRKHPAGYGGR